LKETRAIDIKTSSYQKRNQYSSYIPESRDLDVHPVVYRDDGIGADGQEMKRHFKGNVKQSGRHASPIRNNHSICSLHLISLHQISS